MTLRITGLLDTELDKQLFELVYGSTVRASRWMTGLASGHPAAATKCVDANVFRSKLWLHRANTVAALQHAWRTTLLKKWAADDPITARLLQCVPAGVFASGVNFRECRRYTVCPFCWYRKLRTVLIPLLEQQQGYIATLSVFPTSTGSFPTMADISSLSSLCSRIVDRGNCESCLVIKRPLYLDEQNRWTVAGIILSHVHQLQNLADPATVGIEARWNAQPAAKLVTRLGSDLKRLLKYNPCLWRLDAQELEWLRDLTSKLRSRYNK